MMARMAGKVVGWGCMVGWPRLERGAELTRPIRLERTGRKTCDVQAVAEAVGMSDGTAPPVLKSSRV